MVINDKGNGLQIWGMEAQVQVSHLLQTRHGNFFHQTPTELLEETHNVFSRSIAVPLHGYDDHRELGLKRALCKLGADELPEASIVKSLRYGMIISQL